MNDNNDGVGNINDCSASNKGNKFKNTFNYFVLFFLLTPLYI